VLSAGYRLPIAVIVGVLAGGLVGLANGLVITGLRVVPFIATLGMLGIAKGRGEVDSRATDRQRPANLGQRLAVTFPTPSWLLLARVSGLR